MIDLHFIRPYWLFAFIALFIALWLLKRMRVSHSGWSQIIPSHLSSRMIEQNQKFTSFSLSLPFILGTLAIVALAGPTWKKLPQPVYQVERGSVVVMDMSYSMYSTDLSPNRLTRARYKATDLLDHLNDGDVGLIAYAGDAFIISPLTEDVNNIKLLLPSLSPDLMPELGSNPLAALYLANDMLNNAGHIEGDIYWITDGIDKEDISDLNQWAKDFPHTVNILGVGTKQGAPIKLSNGELLKDDSGAIVIPKLTAQYLNGVATKTSGKYQTIGHDNDDIELLTTKLIDPANEKQAQSLNTGDQWQEFGPYLLLAALPLLLAYFRRGTLLALLPLFLLTPSEQSFAVEWQDLWKTKDQQGQQAFQQEQYEQAAKAFKNPMWQGSSQYKAGNYEAAVDAFSQTNSSEAFYNKGNALAKLQKLDEAIEAYEQALKLNADNIDAQKNKAIIEKLKEQNEQQKQNEQNKDQDQGDNQENQDEQQKGDQQQNDQQGEQQSDDQQGKSQDQQSDQQDNQQSGEQQNDQQSDQQNQDANQKEKSEQEKDNAEQQEAQAKQGEQDANEEGEQKSHAARLAEQQAQQEKDQKHQQLLNKVTDDPYLLLRNKMQLEYQKRRQNRNSTGDKKKW